MIDTSAGASAPDAVPGVDTEGSSTGRAPAVNAPGSATARTASDRGVTPDTIKLDAPDPEAMGLDLVANEPQRRDIRLALNNSFGFGGQNATLVFRRWEA